MNLRVGRENTKGGNEINKNAHDEERRGECKKSKSKCRIFWKKNAHIEAVSSNHFPFTQIREEKKKKFRWSNRVCTYVTRTHKRCRITIAVLLDHFQLNLLSFGVHTRQRYKIIEKEGRKNSKIMTLAFYLDSIISEKFSQFFFFSFFPRNECL